MSLVAACSYSGSTLTKTIATLVSGMAIGLTGAALQGTVDFCVHRRNALLDLLLRQAGSGPAAAAAAAAAAATAGGAGVGAGYAALLGISLVAVALTTLVVHFWAPKAAGGGVALVS